MTVVFAIRSGFYASTINNNVISTIKEKCSEFVLDYPNVGTQALTVENGQLIDPAMNIQSDGRWRYVDNKTPSTVDVIGGLMRSMALCCPLY